MACQPLLPYPPSSPLPPPLPPPSPPPPPHRRYGHLLQLGKERRQRLEESKKKFNLSREINELEHWITDKETLASADETGKDLEHVEVLLKKFDDFQKDLEATETRLEGINSLAQDMIDEGHSDADEIQRLAEVCGHVTVT